MPFVVALLSIAHAGTWMRENPVPTGSPIAGFWGTSPTEVWAYGEGVLLRWDGRTWSREDLPIPAWAACCTLAGKPGDVTAVARHFTSPAVRGCTEHAPCCGYEPARRETWTFHWDGRRWSLAAHEEPVVDRAIMDPPRLPPRGSMKPADVQALWDAHRPPDGPEYAMYGFRIGAHVWAVGGPPRSLLRWDGHEWHVDANPSYATIDALWMASELEGWATATDEGPSHGAAPAPRDEDGNALLHWEGTRWQLVPAPDPLASVWGAGPSDVWAASRAGTVRRWDGTGWTAPEQVARGAGRVWGTGPSDVWLAGCGDEIHHWDGARWSRTPIAISDRTTCPVVWGPSPNDVWAAARSFLYRWDGTSWNSAPAISADREHVVTALWGAAHDDIWAAGGVKNGGAPGAANGDYHPLLAHWDGKAWSVAAVPPIGGFAKAIWGRGPDDVWAVGVGGVILHWDGAAWTVEPSGTTEDLLAVGGIGDVVRAVGAHGTMLVRR